MGYTGSKYYKIKQEEEEEKAILQELPLDIKIQQKFLKDLNTNKRQEKLWFDKLEEELEKLEVEDTLLNVPKRLGVEGSSDG